MIEFLIKGGDSSNQYMTRILLKETIRSKKVILWGIDFVHSQNSRVSVILDTGLK